jgi:hypothetical protein
LNEGGACESQSHAPLFLFDRAGFSNLWKLARGRAPCPAKLSAARFRNRTSFRQSNKLTTRHGLSPGAFDSPVATIFFFVC